MKYSGAQKSTSERGMQFMSDISNPGMMYLTRNPKTIMEIMNQLNVTNDNFERLCKTQSALIIKDILKYVPTINPHYNNSKALISAVQFNKHATVEILIKDGRVDPMSLNFTAIKIAIKNNNKRIFKLLKEYATR